ncbi:MAG: glycosyl hydrolase family 18 protein [Candidatus Dormibacteria bacterium]
MVWRRRTLAAIVVALVGLTALALTQRAGGVRQAPASVTLDGQTLDPGARDVSPRPALGLLLPPGSRTADFTAAIDGRIVPIAPGIGRSARLSVGELAQGSRHRVEVWRGTIGTAHVGAVAVDFQVAAPLQVAASWLVTPRGTTVVVSASRELADGAAVEAALTRAGASVRRDERGIEGRWRPGHPARFTVPAGTRATTGAYLPADFSPSAPLPLPVATSRVDLSSDPGPPRQGLRLRAYYLAGPAAQASLARNASRIGVLSPAFYTVDSGGALVPAVEEAVLATAHAANLSVEPLVTNRDFSATTARGIFRAGADAVAPALVTEARRRGYAGYQLDFEGLAAADRGALKAFSGDLAARLREAGLNYSTAVVPSKDNGSALGQLFGHAGAYDYAQLARGATSISVMSYDQHTAVTDPGPVAGLDWVRRVTEATTAGIDRAHAYLGVPLYYRDWPLHGTPTAGSFPDLLATAGQNDGTITWDFASMTPYVRYALNGEEHVAWTENRTSLLVKQQLAHELRFEGIAAWRLGFEDPAFWELW